jgi:hypothetical protein
MALDEHATSDDGGSELAAVVADDALLDALGGGASPAPAAADAVPCMLAPWRRDVDSEPISRLADIDTALALVGHRPHKAVVDWAVSVFLRR